MDPLVHCFKELYISRDQFTLESSSGWNPNLQKSVDGKSLPNLENLPNSVWFYGKYQIQRSHSTRASQAACLFAEKITGVLQWTRRKVICLSSRSTRVYYTRRRRFYKAWERCQILILIFIFISLENQAKACGGHEEEAGREANWSEAVGGQSQEKTFIQGTVLLYWLNQKCYYTRRRRFYKAWLRGIKFWYLSLFLFP